MVDKKKKRIIKYSLFSIMLILLLASFITLSLFVFNGAVFKSDQFFLTLSKNTESNFLTIFFKIVTNFVNPITLGLVSFCILLFSKKQRCNIFALFLNLVIVSFLTLGLKSIFVRIRPESTLVDEMGYSFPSGHTMFAMAFYGFLIYMILQSDIKKSNKICSTIFLNILILLISYSRIYLCAHYFTDVVGGLLISFFYLFIFCFVIHKLKIEKEMDKSKYKKHSFLQGFKYASAGILRAIKEENNLLIQLCSTMLVVVFGISLRISTVEWCVCLILCFIVMCFEIFNTAIENICDFITVEKNEKIKHIKDISAGAVWLMSICSFIVAMIIFIPKLGLLF